MHHLLTITGLEKQFAGQPVLQHIDLTVARGEVVVLLGPSGCGKSTLLRCINGLESIERGHVVFAGQPEPQGAAQWQQRRHAIGMVFQSYHLFPHLSVLENITLGPRRAQRRPQAEVEAEAMVLLERVGLRHKAAAYPRSLSGGQQQRIAIIRALAMRPQLLLLDEITAALDPEMVKEVLEVVLQLARDGMTMLLVTHELSFARAVADRIVFMDAGRISEISTPEQFFTAPRTLRAKQFLEKFSYLEAWPQHLQTRKHKDEKQQSVA